MVLIVRQQDSLIEAQKQIAAALLCGCAVIITADVTQQNALTAVQKDYQRAGLEKALIQIEPMVSLVTLVQNNAVEAVIANSLNTDSAGLRQVMAQRNGSIIPLIEWPKNDVGYSYHWLLSLLTERTRTENLVAKGGNTQLFNLAE